MSETMLHGTVFVVVFPTLPVHEKALAFDRIGHYALCSVGT